MRQVQLRGWDAEAPFAAVMTIVLAVLALFAPTAASMTRVWSHSNTYSHCFLVLPAFIWMLWRSRRRLAGLSLRPCWRALPLLAGAGLLWLTAEMAAAATPAQLALVAMVPLSAAAVLGAHWVRALAYPFAFLCLAVPFGESLIPALMDWTADFTVAGIRLCGVPVFREGTSFTLPSGTWTVVESCSGIRYLFACIMLAALYAWAVYRSPTRRMLFLLGAVAIAIAANWIRAFSIVMVGHLYDQPLALGIDHVVYGWVFFGIVMAIVFLLGELWRVRAPEDSAAVAAPMPDRSSPPSLRGLVPASAPAAVALAVLCIWPLLSHLGMAVPQDAHRIIADIAPRAGWSRDDRPLTDWKPVVTHPLAEGSQTFVRNGERVGVHLALYGRPTADSKLASAENRLVPRDSQVWRQVERGVAGVSSSDGVVAVNVGTLVGPNERVVAWQWYWVGGSRIKSPTWALLAQMWARLRGRNETSALVTVFRLDPRPGPSTPDSLEPFIADMLQPIDAALRSSASDASS